MKLDSARDLLSRIKWVPVVGVLLLVILVSAAVLIIIFSSGYNVKDNIGLVASVEPDTIGVGERASVKVDVKNMNEHDDVDVVVSVKTYSDKLVSYETPNETSINIGPTESRKLEFKLRLLSGALEGEYRIDVKAREKDLLDGVEDTIYLKVEAD